MEKSKQKLVLDHLYLPKVMASAYKVKGIEFEDLVQEGNIGLIMAADRFDVERGVKFSTYAHYWVSEAIFSALTSKSRTVRLPAHIVSLKLQIFKFTEKFILSLGYAPDAALIAKEFKIGKAQVEKILNLTTEHTGDWDPVEECTIEEELEQENTIEHVIKAIRTLGLKEQLILGMKFGLLKSL